MIFQKIIDRIKGRKGTYRSMFDGGFMQITDSWGQVSFSDGTVISSGQKKVDERKNLKPVEVWQSLKIQEPVIDLSDLDKKIKVIKERIKVLSDYTSETNLQEEHEVLGYLEARKKYIKYKELFAYPTTNDELIQNLCKEYKLKLVGVTQYSGTMPQEAIDELIKFKKSCLKIRSDKPIVRLIVPDNDPKIEKRKRDPILLVSSPFGRWDYILGAWDKEVLIVDDLIYGGK